MNIIALDTATEILSVGLLVNNKEKIKNSKAQRYYLEVNGGQKHSEAVMDASDSLFRLASFDKKKLDAVACMEGPGSFTGLRIGFAAAKGLAFALGIPIIPIPTLDCMAFPFSHWPGMVLPLIDAKKKAYFTALYGQGKALTSFLDIGLDDLIKIIKETCIMLNKNPSFPALFLTGPAAPLALKGLSEVFPDTVSDCNSERGYASEILLFASKNDTLLHRKDYYEAGPLYIRKSDAELSENMEKHNG